MMYLASIPGGLIMAGQLIVSLSILVFIHEMGHFLAAKAFKIKVDKFYVFFDAWGKKLFSFKWGETEYGVGWLPLGGYVKIAGMIDESMDKAQMAKAPEPWEFRAKPAWQRFIVMIGGVVMNVILGIIIYSFWLYGYEKEYLPVSEMKQGIYAHPLAEEYGFETGDIVLKVNGKTPERFKDVKDLRIYFGGTITVERNGEVKDIELPGNFFKRAKEEFISPYEETVVVSQIVENSHADKAGLNPEDKIMAVDGKEYTNYFEFQKLLKAKKNGTVQLRINRGDEVKSMPVKVDSAGRLGFLKGSYYGNKYALTPYSILSSFSFGYREAFTTVIVNAIGFSKIFTGDINARDSVQSPIGIMRIFGSVWKWKRFWLLTAMISMILAFMNLLPIPALDGGHIVFILVEMITRRPVSQGVLEKAQVVGMVLLLSLMAFAVGNDILKWIGI